MAVVALLTEGVDRNTRKQFLYMLSRNVALLTEGVDRNTEEKQEAIGIPRRPPHGGRG